MNIRQVYYAGARVAGHFISAPRLEAQPDLGKKQNRLVVGSYLFNFSGELTVGLGSEVW